MFVFQDFWYGKKTSVYCDNTTCIQTGDTLDNEPARELALKPKTKFNTFYFGRCGIILTGVELFWKVLHYFDGCFIIFMGFAVLWRVLRYFDVCCIIFIGVTLFLQVFYYFGSCCFSLTGIGLFFPVSFDRLHLPFLQSTVFINFNTPEQVVFGMTRIQGTCVELCGGWNYQFQNLTFINGDQHLGNNLRIWLILVMLAFEQTII